MTLTLRPTGLASPAYQDRQDWTVFEDGKEVGRTYEDGLASVPTELRWLVITVYVRPDSGIVTSGKVPRLTTRRLNFSATASYRGCKINGIARRPLVHKLVHWRMACTACATQRRKLSGPC
jgi:hypothetical protein